jgi:hypothetical protein
MVSAQLKKNQLSKNVSVITAGSYRNIFKEAGYKQADTD